MKLGVFVLFFIGLLNQGKAQGNLQFNQVLLVDSALRTVPANKAWKITAISGSEYRLNECVDISANSNHELKSARCGFTQPTASFIGNYSISLFLVNGNRVINSIEGLPNSVTAWCNSNCTSSCATRDFTCANKSTNPNILPMWLPAGATLRSGGPNTWLSVLEFNIVP
ncbi:MAG: hypothetical protein FJZ75_10850 [Bacteroidetes bacterium]|nr:hypothetical protein [Bacteroidota bacterium]